MRLVASLAELRRSCGLTQTEAGNRFGMMQNAVSRLERQHDWKVSTLRAYVAATGGSLRLIAEYDDSSVEIGAFPRVGD